MKITNLIMETLRPFDSIKETTHQRVQSSIRKLRDQRALPLEDLRFLEELFLRLDVTEKKLEEDISRRGNTRDQIKLAWQKTIKPTNGVNSSYDANSKTSEEQQVRLVVERKAKLLVNLESAVTNSVPARDALKGMVATYYADRVQEINTPFHLSRKSFNTEFGIDVVTSANELDVRKLDALLVLDFKAPGFNTGYFGIDRAVIKFIPILTRLLSGNTINRVEQGHPLLRSTKKGGYTQEQLQTVLSKLIEYKAIDQQRRLERK